MGEGLKRAFNAARETRRTLSPAQRSVLAFLASDPGIIGLDNAGNVGGGYDQMIYWPSYYEHYDIEGSTEGLVELVELIELADLMIDRWTTFKAGLHQNKSPESS